MYRYSSTEDFNGKIYLHCESFPVKRRTEKGVWIDIGFREKFILSRAKKKWAYPTKEEALHNFIMRKVREVEIIYWRRCHARRAYFEALEIVKNKKDYEQLTELWMHK